MKKPKVEKYRKKPVVVEAVKWDGNNLAYILSFTGRHHSISDWEWERVEELVAAEGLKIFTLEGPLKASIGDYIIRGIKGECYPCKPDIFKATYEKVKR
jgi:hypothetical protein